MTPEAFLAALTSSTVRLQELINDLDYLCAKADHHSTEEDLLAALGALEAGRRLLTGAIARETIHMEVPPEQT
jgi:hypothetical protein